jgi:hypothetical protein
MVINKIKALAISKARVAELEKSIAAQLNQELAALPAEYGFDNVPDFIAAVKTATGGKVKAPRGKRKTATVAKAPAGGRKRRKRAVITADTKAQVKSLSEAGKTGAEIARAVRISLPSVQNIKKELGLVKARK